jgi:hypothetical protein
MGTGILLGAASFFLVLLILTVSPGAREGSYRRGQGWYLDVRSTRQTLVPGSQPASRFERVSSRSIRLWTVGGSALVLLGVIAWTAFGQVVPGVISGVMGVLLLALAWDGTHRNRQADRFEELDDPP